MIKRCIASALRLAAGVSFCLAVAGGAARAEELTVESRTVDDLKAVFGTVESLDTTLARSRIGGTVEQLVVDEGHLVEEGQLIARVEDPKLVLKAAALDSRVEAARAQVELAQTELDRVAKLRRSGTASQAILDISETELSVAKGALAALEAERALVAEEQAEGDVLAPKPGRVLEVRITGGQVVLPGETLAVIAAEVYVLRLQLPERHARFLNEGDPVLVGARGLAVDGADLREGTVLQVYPELDRGRVVADVTVSGLGDYFVGERTRVYVATGQRRAIVVPRAYLFERSGVTFVRLKSGGDTVVQPGQPIDGGVEILSGLEAGDVLIEFGGGSP